MYLYNKYNPKFVVRGKYGFAVRVYLLVEKKQGKLMLLGKENSNDTKNQSK